MTPEPVGVVHHLALARDWEEACRAGEYRISTLGSSLEAVGFIHASFAEQVDATASRFYAGIDEPLVLLDIDTARVGVPVVVEPAASGERFPHLYGPLAVSAVTSVRPARMVGGRLVIGGSM